ncbi:MAG: DUF488 domain-containing protein [bacterium]|nr:DUF488 domain-containing protein [bacterium]
MLKNKAITLATEKTDGIRVCVMRSIHDDYQFDLWYQALAPSKKLIENYVIKKKWSWTKFKKAYLKEQKNNDLYLKSLIKLIKKTTAANLNVTLLCGEKDYHGCHREIIIEKCLELEPKLKDLLV